MNLLDSIVSKLRNQSWLSWDTDNTLYEGTEQVGNYFEYSGGQVSLLTVAEERRERGKGEDKYKPCDIGL